MKERILVVDDDASFLEVMAFSLEEEGFEVVTARDGREALEIFTADPLPVVITDLKMPRLDGMGLLERVHKLEPEALVVVITAFGDMEMAVKAMKAGAFDFLPKPCERDHFKLTVRRAFEHVRLKREVAELKDRAGSESKRLVVHSRAMEKVVALADRVAASEATVLIEGESGAGKELLARRIHRRSGRRDKPFVAVNGGAIPKDLLEDELFGHVKGAFTGATGDRKGRFMQADGGTIFLDEIAELSPGLQTRLLRVLQERVVDVVGKDEPLPVDVRVIAATHADLQKAVREGGFRQDLFFRLNVVPLTIPPLRERIDDILPLAKHFLKQHGGGREWKITPEAAARLEAMPWPGNVRELENLCQRATLLCDEAVLSEAYLQSSSDTERGAQVSPASVSLPKEGASLIEIERKIIETALRMNDYNRTRTAKFLRIPRHVLLYRIEKYEIDPKGNA
ncbi:MAG: sigma-54-dependent Fis family transcriptional regulator [Myxococcales bacterium]|nr:MAG: sigma-54-dependent Fis family transcriptional regulator [Myxococcales bacterium]